jgi:hypothetical protein
MEEVSSRTPLRGSTPRRYLQGRIRARRGGAHRPAERSLLVSERYPKIRLRTESRGYWIFEGLRLDFYMRRPHTEMARAVMRSMDTYVNAVGAENLGFYVDDEGDSWELDHEAWALNRRNLLEDPWPRIILEDARETGPQKYQFESGVAPSSTRASPRSGYPRSTWRSTVRGGCASWRWNWRPRCRSARATWASPSWARTTWWASRAG